MFTGLIESVGTVAEVADGVSGRRLRLRTALAHELAPGDSLAVNGVCLTVTAILDDVVAADIGPETLRVTTLGRLVEGQMLNLERPIRGDGRFGGHFVQGHVDGTGTVREVRDAGDAHWLTIGLNASDSAALVEKGSVAVDGVSLTVAALGQSQFDIMIIPFTWACTTLAGLRAGDQVNLEFDMIGKYVARAVALAMAGRLDPASTTD